MPCRCDGYEVEPGDQIRDMNKKIEFLEGQLCNARSLLHKILKQSTGNWGATAKRWQAVRDILPKDLLDRAQAHIEILVGHKRAEAKADADAARREVDRLDRLLDQQLKATEAYVNGAEKTRKELELARAKLHDASEPSDEDLLG